MGPSGNKVQKVNQLLEEKKLKEAMVLAQHLVYIDPLSKANLEALLRCFLSFGQLESAERIVKQLEVVNPILCVRTYSETLLKMKEHMANVRELYEQNKFRECLFSIQLKAKDTPNSIFLQIIQVKCFIVLENFADAEKIVKDLLLDVPNHSEVIFCQAQIAFYTGRLEESLLSINKCLEIDPDNESREEMKTKVELLSESLAEAEKFKASRKYSEAIDIYTDILRYWPLHKNLFILVLIKRAKAYVKTSQYNDAISDLSHAIKVKPTRMDLLFLRAECYFAIQNKEKCAEDCKTLMDCKPSQQAVDLFVKINGNSELSLVSKLIREGKSDEIAKHYVKCFEKNPTEVFFVSALMSLLDTGDLLTIESLMESVEDCKNLAKLVPESLKTLIASVKKSPPQM